MNDKMKRRLAGAAVLLALVFIVVSLLPTPNDTRQKGGDVVTIPLNAVQSDAPPVVASAAEQGAPQTLAAPGEPAADADDGTDPGLQSVGSGGDDDGPGDESPAASTPTPQPLKQAPAPKAEPAPPAPKPVSKPEPQPELAVKPAPPPKPAPEPKPKPAPKPDVKAPPKSTPPPAPSTAASSTSAPWYVQVGGFADIDNARRVQAKLKALGQPNIIAPVGTSKGTIYRVRGGPYASESQAQAALAKIKGAYPGAQLISP
ncbi:SPOR domain-containing protein [Solimonas marina]|uniref:SPOR domain-containing protein n=1 Tax=Solimonas marina TaxID=2714601 RepID=A0A970BBD3_9GAMM|nr:SPOR domain-containing protein [Solimonas marina]NKF24291.1 SPOR domain-containing protein [Solimonas marina]